MTPKEVLKEIFNGMYNKQGFIKEFKVIEQALEHAKKGHELLALYKELGGIEQDIEYLCGLRDCMIEFSVEKPMEHIYSGIKEYKEKRDGLNYQINQLEEELK